MLDPPESRSSGGTWNGWQLRPSDQLVWATLLAFGLILGGGWHLFSAMRGRHWVNIEQAAPRTYRFQVDLNLATWPELAQLPDVGETLARRIVARRESQGPFSQVDQLGGVEGIGPVTLEKLRPYLVIGVSVESAGGS